MTTTTTLVWCAAGAVLLVLCSCGRDQEQHVAQVDGRPITQAELDAYLNHRNLPRDDERKRRTALEEYARREALADAIETSGLLDREAIEVELREYRKEMLLSRYFERFLREQVTDQAVLNYYNGHPDEFSEERVRVAHILLRTRRDMDDSERQVKLTTAREVYGKLLAGEDFAELAANYSEDKVSGKKGGDLGWLKRGAISEVFTERAFSLENGDVTEPFETPFGFHVVKLLEPPRVVRRPFESAKGDIRYQLRNRAKDAELERLLEGVEIEIY